MIATVPVSSDIADRVAFDGERILILNAGAGQNSSASLTLLRAADFSTLRVDGFPPIGGPALESVASDGLSFWVTLDTSTGPVLARY